jgi:serpin B
VAEQGTEAAAVTGNVMALAASVRPEVQTFRVDRPFLFFIVDHETDAVLFQGKIVNPA